MFFKFVIGKRKSISVLLTFSGSMKSESLRNMALDPRTCKEQRNGNGGGGSGKNTLVSERHSVQCSMNLN